MPDGIPLLFRSACARCASLEACLKCPPTWCHAPQPQGARSREGARHTKSLDTARIVRGLAGIPRSQYLDVLEHTTRGPPEQPSSMLLITDRRPERYMWARVAVCVDASSHFGTILRSSTLAGPQLRCWARSMLFAAKRPAIRGCSWTGLLRGDHRCRSPRRTKCFESIRQV